MNISVSRNILIDEPVKEDEFSGGGHLRTAKALANTIRQFDGHNRAVGLEGAWGAGKSTIVELARKELESESSDKAFSVFTFDLWTHQTSNFKRSMLEALLTWIEAQKGVSNSTIKKIDNIRSEIRDKIIDTKIKNKKIFDLFGVIFIIFAFFLPFIYLWLSPSVVLPKISPVSNDVYLIQDRMPFGSIISILLLLCMFSFAFLRFCYFLHKSKLKLLSDKLKDAASATVAIFSKDAEISHERKTIKEINPSQEEFYETFQRILSLYQTEQKRLVIVIDNIDRIPDDRLPDAWSDIRSMVVGQVTTPTNEQFITIIVPYDRQHVLTALKSGGSQEGDVIRKSFDAVYQVSAPIVSDASTFFKAKFQEALSSQYDVEIAYRVYKIFEYSIRKGGNTPTPRQMLAFINAVSSLWGQWDAEIDLVAIAVFVVHASDLYAKPELLRDHDTIDRRYRDLARFPDLDKCLAALAYNVPPKFALQVLLHDEIANVFTQEKNELVVEISMAPGFAEILPDVFVDRAHEWSSEGALYLGCVVKHLAALTIPNSVKLVSGNELFKNISSLPVLDPSKWEEANNLTYLFDLCDSDQVLSIVSELDNWISRMFNKNALTFEDGSYWVRLVGNIVSKIDKLFQDKLLSKQVRAKLSVFNQSEFILGAAYFADQTDLHISEFNFIKPFDIHEDLSTYMLSGGAEFADIWPEIVHLMKDDVAFLITKLSMHLFDIDYADEVSVIYEEHVLNLYTLLTAVQNFEAAPTELHRLITDGALYKGMKSVHDKGDPQDAEFLAKCFWLVIKQSKDTALPLTNIQGHRFGNLLDQGTWVQEVIKTGNIGQDIIDKIAELVVSDSRIGDLIRYNSSAPTLTGLYSKLLLSMAKNGRMHAPRLEDFVDNYEFLESSLGEYIEAFLKIVGKLSVKDPLQKIDVKTISVKLIRDIGIREESLWVNLLSKVDEWLRSIDSDTWNEALRNEDNIFLLLHERAKLANINLMPEKIREPVINHALALALEEVDAGNVCDFIIDTLRTNTRRGVGKDLLERLDGKNVTVNGFRALWFSYKSLVNIIDFELSPNIAIRKIIIPALQNDLDVTLDFFSLNHKKLKKAVSMADEDVKGEMLEYILSQISNSSESTSNSEKLYEVISYLGISDDIESIQAMTINNDLLDAD